MNRLVPEGKNASGLVVASSANTRLSGSWLITARVVWLALVIPSLGLFVGSLVVSYQQMQTVCFDPVTCTLSGALPAQVQRSLQDIGLSISEFATLVIIFFVITAAIWYGVSFLIFWRRSDDWLALLAAFVLAMFNITSSGNTASAMALTFSFFALPLSIVNFLGQVSLLVFFLLFPNGRLVPRWMGLILLFVVVGAFFSSFPSITSPFNTNWPAWLNGLFLPMPFGAVIYSQIYRYRRVSTPLQRQQTKWIVLGVAVAIVVVLSILTISPFLPSNGNSNNLGAVLFFLIVWPVALLLIPLSIGFSILRYRLYDIDVLINRSLVYGTLTVSLALVYIGLVVGLQALVRVFTEQGLQSPVVIVISTLAIAALFQPLRQRLQVIIDRRFYRQKYDAAKTLEVFSATLRNEVDLNQLSEQLITVVQEIMQPSHIVLWMRQPIQTEIRSPQPSPQETEGDEEITTHGV